MRGPRTGREKSSFAAIAAAFAPFAPLARITEIALPGAGAGAPRAPFVNDVIAAGLAVGLAVFVILSRGVAEAGDWGWATTEIPLGVHLLPFWAMIGVSAVYSLIHRDRLVAACWAAIIPTAFFIFNFAATGWSQFGYRYGLDFTPFLWLLVARVIGDEIKWYHKLLISIGVLVNLMGLLWIYQLGDSNAALGGFLRGILDALGDDPSRWTWVRF